MEKSDLQRFRNECVAAHNFYRAAHGTPPLCWSSRLAESAQKWAQQLASTGSLRYSSEKDIGENLACLWGSELNGQKITRIWYEEGKYFDYDKPRFSSRTRSFSQVVWEGTREFGAGAAVTKHGKQIVVARYSPPANKKDVARNVKKARSTRDNEQPLAYDTRWSRLYLGLKEFHEECLSVHNEYRLRHGAAPLHWSAELAWEAQQWAEKLARSGELRHNDDDTVGENLAGMMGGELTGRETTDMWYDEIEDYDFDNPGYSEDTSNFTQVVWVASETLGVGRAVDGELCVVVAFYEPPGNMEGSFGDNVLRMGSAIRERKRKELKGFVPPAPDLESFRLECLVTHNYFRARHGSPPLVLSSALTDEAQYWAERLLVTGAMEGLDNSRIGISVAVLDKAHISGIKVSELWYKEILNYDFDSPGFSNETLDFSQLVWLSSRKLGVGKATGAEGVTVVVARYEPVGNIDGLFVQNVRRRGHERGSCEPMIFHVEYRYRVRADSKSTNSFLSWEHEDTQTFGELEGDTRKTSDLDQFDENENILHRADEQESANTLTVSDHFTRLVWIDPNSPTLQRKGVAEKTTQEKDDDEQEEEEERRKEEEEEDREEDDARTAYEQASTPEAVDLTCATAEPLIQTEEAELEEADLFSDPEDDLYQHVCEIRRSLSLDSEGTEPEMQRGNVLSKVAFFEMFQHGVETQSPSNSESSLRRSLIQEELEELVSRPKRQSLQEEDEREEEQIMEEEHECQLEFDDLFPAHREGDEEVQVGEEIFDDEGEEEDESLVSVSDAEDVLDFTDYDTRHEGLQDFEYEDNVCLTHEFVEEEPSTMEIFDFSDEDASHQYADVTEEEDQPLSSTKSVYEPRNLSTATEFQKTETFKLCEDEPPDLIEDATDNYSEELFETSESVVEVPQACFQRTLDPEFCYVVEKQDHVEIRMKELICKIGVSPVEDSEEATADLTDFNETIEGKVLETVINGRNDRQQQDERTPVEEVCEAVLRDSVESEIDFEALFAKLERAEIEKENIVHETSRDLERTQSPESVQVVLRDHESERTAGMEQIGVDLELVSVDQLSASDQEEQVLKPDISLDYECKPFTAVEPESSVESVCENTIESVRRDREPEREMDLKELHVRLESSTKEEESQEEIINNKDDALREDQQCEAVLRDYDQERARVLEETSLELNLVFVSSDSTHSLDEPVEPLPYDVAPKSSTVSELPEVTEYVEAEARQDVRSEINFEEMFRRLDEEHIKFADEATETRRLEETTKETSWNEETLRASLYVEEDRTVDELLHCIPSSPEYISHEIKQSEPTAEIGKVKQTEQHRSASLYMEEHTVVEEVATETPSSPKHIVGEGANLEQMKVAYEEKETLEDKRASLFEEEDSVVNEVVPDTPSSPKYTAGESRNAEPFEEINEEPIEESKRASVFYEEETLADEVTTDTPSSPKHISGESRNVESFEEIHEEVIEESKRASAFHEEETLADEVTTDTPSSPKHIAGESQNVESFEEIKEEPIEESKRASVFFEEKTLADEVTTDTPSSPKHIAGESRNVESFEEINEEPIEESKRASVFFEEKTLADEVTTDTPSSPKHMSGESRNVESFEEIHEEAIEESRRASVFYEEETLADKVTTDTPSSPNRIAGESRNVESFEEINEEPIEESKRASVFFEEKTLADEVTTDTPSSPKHIAGESRNVESFEEINEEPIEESKRASVFYEEETLADKVTTDTPSSPNHIAGESRNVESFEEINEEPIEESKRASVFFEEKTLADEVTTDTPSSPKHIAGESRNVESFEEINEEPIEESKRASVFYEEETLADEVTTDTPSSPNHLAGESRNVESFEEIHEEAIEESKRASVFFGEETLADEVTTDTPPLPKHIAGESRNVESFEEIHEEVIEESKRASVFHEEETLADEVTTDTPSSPKHIAGESQNVESFEEIKEEPIEESKRASVFFEEKTLADEVTTDTPLSPKHIAGESRNVESFEEIHEEVIEESKRATVFFEAESLVDKVTTYTPSSPKHIAGERRNVESFEEINEEPIEESKRASVFCEVETLVDEVTTDTPSSPKHIAGESQNMESFDEIIEESTEESKRASLFVEEDSIVDEVTTDRPSSPKHVAGESHNLESFEKLDEEPTEESKRASLFLEEDSIVDEVKTDRPSSPKHIAGENENIESFEEVNEEPSEESKRASLFVEDDLVVDEVISDIPSSPKYLAGESVSLESFEEVVEVPSDEDKRASLFLEEHPAVYEVTTTTPSVPVCTAGEAFNITSAEEIHEGATPDEEHAHELEESDDEVRYDYVSLESADGNNYIVSEFTNSARLEVRDEDESPESDYGEQFEEYESIFGTQRFIEPSQSAHIAGEIYNTDAHDEALEEVLQVGESLEYEDSQEMVTSTDIVETSQPSFHVAGELSNIDPQEESSEEEKPVEGAYAEEIEETEVQAATVVLNSPQSLLSIAAAALELKIDAAQHDAAEVQEYSEQEQPEVPVIFVDIAGEISENEEDNTYYEEEEPQDDHKMETESYEDNEETVVSYPTEEQTISCSHVAAELCESEFTLEIEDIEEHREFAEPFEESEEGSVSELMSECSSSPLHVSSELKDFQDYETINEEHGTETYHVITYEESDYVSEKLISKGLPSLYITEELSPQEFYEENFLNEKSVVIETAQEYNEVEEPLEMETSLVISEPPLQTAAEFSDSDYTGGVEEDDDLSERDFLEGFEEMEEVVGREIPLASPKEPATAVSEVVLSGPQIVEEEEEEELLDETDHAQILIAQEPLVSFEHHTSDVEEERVVHKDEEEVRQIALKEESRIIEAIEEKGFATEIQKEQRSVEIKSSYQVVESKEIQHEERIFKEEKARQMEISHEFGEKVEVLAKKTTRQVASTTSYVATGVASEEIRYKAEKNGGQGILHEEVKKIQEVSFTPIHQTSRQTSWERKENGRQFETTDELSESILEKEAQDQESEKFERQLSQDEQEVRLLKSEVMEYKAVEQQAPLANPRVTVERETTFMKTYVVHSAAEDTQEIKQVLRQDDVLVILKDDEASLDDESAGEQFEEEIDIMRMDEALSEEEFRGEGAESMDRSQSRSSKADSVEEIDKRGQEEESDTHEGDQQEPLYEEEVDISEVQPVWEEEMKAGAAERMDRRDQESESDIHEGDQQEPLYEEEVDISEVQPVYEEELEMQKMQKQEEETSSETEGTTVLTSTFEEEIEVAAYEFSDEPVNENVENKLVGKTEVRTQSPEEELEVSAFQEAIEEHADEVESGGPTAVFEDVDISASQSHDSEVREVVMIEDEELKTTEEMESFGQGVEDESNEYMETTTRRKPLDLSQVDLYDDDESATTRYYVELSSTESLEQAYEEVEDKTVYTETYVRQGDPLEENLEEFILVRYSDEFESSGEEDISDHREIYVIPEEENDVDNNNVAESAKDDHKAEKEPLPESFFEGGFENMGLEEIRESPEFEIDDSPEDELDEEEQRQLEEYERLESFVILEEKLSQVESDEDCDDDNGCFKGEEGDENVFHSDVHSSSEETLHEDELGETMIASSIREAAVAAEAKSKEEEKTADQISGEPQEHSEDSSSRKEEEMPTQEGAVEDTCSKKGDKKDVSLPKEPSSEEKESRDTKDEKTEQSLSGDSSGEQNISSEGSLSSTPSVDLEELEDFEQNCLLEHNLYRRQHRAKPLKWSEELAAGAKEWVEHMASVNCLERCEGKEVGQNLVSAHGKELRGSEVVEMWYKEVTDYNFEVPAFNAKCGNFTQVVWASSREFGVAKCVSDDGTQYVAALYKPAGNVVGEFKDNVKPPRDSSGRLKRRRSSARRRSGSGVPPDTPAEREKFKTECVISHNYYRTFHNAPPLRWSPLLAAEAQNYAERLVKTDSLTHSGQKDRGENLAYTWDSPLSARGAVDMWYDEVQDYDFECPGYTSDTGHFTQLVWVGTEEFGMGMAVAPDGRNVVVGRYFPPGNIVGQFKENVRPREIAGIP